MDGALTPICEACGVSLCWDVSEAEGLADEAFWNQWKCQDCNGGHRMSLEQWRIDHPKTSEPKKIPKVDVVRNVGHPWDGRPGFDVMHLNASSQSELDQLVKKAESRYWQQWLIGTNEATGMPGGLMYKPSGICEDWFDTGIQPHPGRLVST